MKLEISSFPDTGQFSKERLILKVLSDVDVGGYAVFCSPASKSGGPVAGRKAAYWFPDEDVKAGDLVILYTKTGTSSKKELSGGRTAHFFYWGLDNSVWGGGGNVAVLLRVSEWAAKTPGEAE